MENTVLIEQLNQLVTEIAKFTEKGNKAAGARARKMSLNVTRLLKDFRKSSVAWSRENKKVRKA